MKKHNNSELLVPCEENPVVTLGFLLQKTANAESFSTLRLPYVLCSHRLFYSIAKRFVKSLYK